MDGQSASACGVRGHSEHLIAGQGDVGVIAGNEQVALIVIAAGASDGVHELLVDLVYEAVGLSLSGGASAPLVPQAVPAQLLVL